MHSESEKHKNLHPFSSGPISLVTLSQHIFILGKIENKNVETLLFFTLHFFFKFYFIFKLYKIVLVLPNIKMDPPQVYMCSPSWTLLPPPTPYHPSGSSQCTSPKHPVSCIEPGLETHFIRDIIHVLMPFSQIFPRGWWSCYKIKALKSEQVLFRYRPHCEITYCFGQAT